MNLIYKLVWNRSLNALVVASEFAKGKGKASGASRATATVAGLALAVSTALAMNPAQAANVMDEMIKVIDAAGSRDATAYAAGSIAIGAGANAQGDNGGDYSAIAIGADATASGQAALSIGESSNATGNRATAIGNSSKATGDNATVIGADSEAAANSTALGRNAKATAQNSVALGANSTTTANLNTPGYNPGNSTLSGTASTANGEVSVGSVGYERRVTNVAAGAAATDAVNVSQLKSLSAKTDALGTGAVSVLGGGTSYDPVTGVLGGTSFALTQANAIAGTTGPATSVGAGFTKVDAALHELNLRTLNSEFISVKGSPGRIESTGFALAATPGTVAIGDAANSSGGDAIAIGFAANARHGGIAIGDGAIADERKYGALGTSVAVGQRTYAGWVGSTALGASAYATAIGSTAVGYNTYATAENSLAVGARAQANAKNSVAVGEYALATAENSVALGAGSETTGDLSLAGYNPGNSALSGIASTANGEVSVGKADNERRITNLAAGAAATDAVNVSQLQSMSAKADATGAGVAAALGGGSTYTVSTGNLLLPMYTLDNDTVTVTSVGGAIANLDGRVTGNADDILDLDVRVTDLEAGEIPALKNLVINDGPGVDAAATGEGAIAMGDGSDAQDDDAIAIGRGSVAGGQWSIALGDATVNGPRAMAMGADAQAVGGEALAIGSTSHATAGGAVAVGANTTASALHSVAVGLEASATADNAVAIGLEATADAENSVAIGYRSETNADLAAAGYNPGTAALSGIASTAGGEVSVGSAGYERRVTNVAAGAAATDAVNVSQLQSMAGQVSAMDNALGTSVDAALGGGTSYNPVTGRLGGTSFALTQANAIAGTTGAATSVGAGFDKVDAALGSLDTRVDALASGGAAIKNLVINDGAAPDAIATGTGSIAMGDGAHAELSQGVAIGAQAKTRNLMGVAIGSGAEALSSSSIAMGRGAAAGAVGADSAIAIGPIAKATGSDSVALGYGTEATHHSVALGSGSKTTADLTVAGYNPGDAALAGIAAPVKGEVSVGSAGNERRVTNIAAGAAATDAVNVSQLQSMAAKSAAMDAALGDSTAAGLGGGAEYDPVTGAVTAPSYSVGGTTVNTVGAAIGNLDSRVGTLEDDLDSGTVGLVKQDATSRDITVAADTDGTRVDFTGTSGARVLSGVAAGMANTDAVNIAQLKGVTAGLGGGAAVNPDGTITGPSYTLTNPDGSTATVDNAGDAFTQIDGRVADNTTAIGDLDSRVGTLEDDLDAGAIGLVKQDATSRDITVAADTDGTRVDFTGTSGARVLSGVAAGMANTDAVNIAQLKGVTAGLGGGAAVNPDGSITGPSYTLTNPDGSTATVDNAGDAFTQIDARVEDNTTAITNITNGAAGLVKQDATSRDITVAAATDGTRVDFTGTSGARVLDGVAAGTVGVGSLQAINGAQLHGVSESVATHLGGGATVNADGTISTPSYSVGGTTVNTVGAAIGALDTRVDGVEDALTDLDDKVNDLGVGLVKQDATTRDISIGGNTDGDTDGDRVITGVAEGEADNDAVNVAQLKRAGLVDSSGQTLDAVVYDAGSSRSQVTFAGIGGTVLANVADGRIASGSREAVNGGQIASLRDSLQSQITSIDNRVTTIEVGGGAGGGAANPYYDANERPVSGSTPVPADVAYTPIVASGSASASGDLTVAAGAGAEARADGSVALGAGAVADRENTVSVGAQGQERQITNVAAGTKDTDAVNVGQLKQTFQHGQNPDGSTDYSTINMGQPGTPVTMSNVAKGEVSAGSTQAINGSQLYDWTLNHQNQFSNVSLARQIDEVERAMHAGVATALAARQAPYVPGHVTYSVGAAGYKSQGAVGVSSRYTAESGRWSLEGGFSHNGDGTGVYVGVSGVLGD